MLRTEKNDMSESNLNTLRSMQFCILPWYHFLATDAFGLTPPTTKTPCNCTHLVVCTDYFAVLFIWCAMTSTSLDTTSHKATASTTLLVCCSFELSAMPSPPLWMQVIWRCREEGEAIWTRPAVCHFNFITFHHPVQWDLHIYSYLKLKKEKNMT